MDALAPGWPADADAVAHVFVAALDDSVTIAGNDGHHLQRVRRLRAGERVTAADGRGAWRAYEVADVARGALVLRADGAPRGEPLRSPEVAVAVALVKGGLDDVVAQLTELGVAAVEPVRTERGVVRWDDDRARTAVARLRDVARAAAMQSRRARVPDVADVVELGALAGRPDVVVAERSGIPAAALAPPASGRWTVVVGPEGGLGPADLAVLGAAPRVSVGPHVLRAATAPIAVAATLLARAS